MGAANRKDMACIGIAGVFHANAGLGPHQKLGDQVQGVLSAQGDEDFVFFRAHAAARQHARPDLLDKLRIVLVETVLGPGVNGIEGQGLARGDAPIVHRKELRIRLPVNEGIGVIAPVRHQFEQALARRMDLKPTLPAPLPGRTLRRRGGFRQIELGGYLRLFLVDKKTDPFPGNEKAFVGQGLVC